jgi:hypothetical protein
VAEGSAEGFEDKYTYGRRANGIYIPRYQNIGNDKRDYLRGFGYQGGASRGLWHKVAELAFEAILKIPCHYLQILEHGIRWFWRNVALL